LILILHNCMFCSSDHALRSYLYLFIHGLVAGPASSIFGGEHKVCSVLLCTLFSFVRPANYSLIVALSLSSVNHI